MDPITAAIVAALTLGVTSGITETSKKAVSDAYETLKGLLKKKFGHESEVVKSVESLEIKPDSTGRQATLQEEITTTHVEQDPDILKAAQTILNLISSQPGGSQYSQYISGSYNAITQSGPAAININQPKEQ